MTQRKRSTTPNQGRDTILLVSFQQQNNYFEKLNKLVPSPPSRQRRDTPARSRKASKSLLVVFPAELPSTFFEELDCVASKTQFAAFHVDLSTDRLLREDGMAIRACADDWGLAALLRYDPVAEWCQRNGIDLSTGRHWLLYDYVWRKSYIADPRTAMKCLEKQALVRKPKASAIDG